MPLLEHTSKFTAVITDILFPKRCISCGGYGVWFCKECRTRVIALPDIGTCGYCLKGCASIRSAGELCTACKQQLGISGLLYLYSFKHPTVERLLHVIKYSGVTELLEISAAAFNDVYGALPYISRPQAITDRPQEMIVCVPIPLHTRKLRIRGFNQSEILAERLAQMLGWSYNSSLVKRKKYTLSQTTLNKEERQENMKEAFHVSDTLDARKLYIIIDDVITTGTTIAAVAKALRNAGAKNIWAITIAHG